MDYDKTTLIQLGTDETKTVLLDDYCKTKIKDLVDFGYRLEADDFRKTVISVLEQNPTQDTVALLVAGDNIRLV